MAKLNEKQAELFTGRNWGVVATIREDGSPQATPARMQSPPTALHRNTAAAINWFSSRLATTYRRRAGVALAKRLTMPTLKIRTQIILPFLLLMLILGLIGTYLTTSLVATSLENRIADQLVHAQDAALDAAVKLQGRQVAAVRLVANTEGVDRAVRAGDATALPQLVVPLEVNNRLGTVMIFNSGGKTILEVSQPDSTNPDGLVFKSGTDLSNEPIVMPGAVWKLMSRSPLSKTCRVDVPPRELSKN